MLEVQGQGVGMVDDFQDLSPWVTGVGGEGDGFSVFSVVVRLFTHTLGDSPYKDTSQIGLRPTLMASF